jgi:signal transduction histidine kinase
VSTPPSVVDHGRSDDLLDAIPCPVYVWRRSRDGAIRLVFANEAGHREMHGRTPGLIGIALDELTSNGVEIVQNILDTLADGMPRQMEHEYRWRTTGELSWLRTSFTRTGADEVVIFNEDFTQRRLYEDRLAANEARFRELLERAPAIICTFRAPDHVYEMANEACRRLIGRDDIIGRPLAEVQPDIAEQGLLLILDQVLATGEPFVAHAMPVRIRPAPDAPPEERYFNIVAQAIQEADGTRSRTFAHAVDLTDLVTAAREQRQLEAQLRESQKMEAVGRLAGGVAHDFNNLLSAILGYTDLVLLDPSATSTVHEEVEEIRKAAQRAAQLTRQLLAFGGRQIRRPTRIELDAVVADADRLLGQLLGEQIELTLRTGAHGAVVCMDRGELDQILVNLAANARDAMPHGGRVTIETSCPEEPATGDGRQSLVLLSISDTGDGIAAETVSHIFEPFYTTRGVARTGLGLSMVYGIVEQAGGRIEVDTEVGTGTRFRIYLPAASATPPERT